MIIIKDDQSRKSVVPSEMLPDVNLCVQALYVKEMERMWTTVPVIQTIIPDQIYESNPSLVIAHLPEIKEQESVKCLICECPLDKNNEYDNRQICWACKMDEVYSEE